MQPIKICIVEDLEDVRDEMVSLLTLDERFELQADFPDAEKAAAELPAWQPDIIIMDINLPGMSGIDLVRSFPNPSFRVVFVTAYDAYAIEALRLSAIDYLFHYSFTGVVLPALHDSSHCR